MKDGTRNTRIAVYYLLADKFDKLDVFRSVGPGVGRTGLSRRP